MSLVLLLGAVGCGETGAANGDRDIANAPDLLVVDKAAACVDTFGDALTNSFGRLDGTLIAIVAPDDTQCTMYNSDHMVLEIAMNGAVYRAVVNVISDRDGDQRVRLFEKSLAMATPFAEGWHPDVTFDYDDLGVHNAEFEPLEMTPLVERLSAPLTIGAPIAVYTTSSGGGSSHLVHRNKRNADGAIVVDPTSATPRHLLLAFFTQSF